MENLKNIIPEENCECGKPKRFCKGCQCDVTDTMFCYCGELPLSIDSTYSEQEIINLNLK